MAQSPLEPGQADASDDYMDSWDDLSSMIARGRSFSGRERHCAFLNTRGAGGFANVSGASGLDFVDDGRGLAVTDWDGDGDLDLWMTQRNGPRVRFIRNDVSAANRYVAFRLEGVACNRDAIGARIRLSTSARFANRNRFIKPSWRSILHSAIQIQSPHRVRFPDVGHAIGLSASEVERTASRLHLFIRRLQGSLTLH